MASIRVCNTGDGEVIHLGPIQVRVLEDGSNTDDRIGAVEITIPPHMEGPPQHFHVMHDETFLVMSGTVRFVMGSDQRDCKAGDYVVVANWSSSHLCKPIGYAGCFLQYVYPGLLRRIFPAAREDRG